MDLVLVHDGVRPFADRKLIRRVIRASAETGAAVPVMPLTDSIKRVKAQDEQPAPVARAEYVCVQTPQGFRYSILAEALEIARRDGFFSTDESALVERLGHSVALVPGSEWNIKITRPIDMQLAKVILKKRET
jgi:2-C-methyl-D-erythritol 4-phosphate cytidylyltransferase